MFGFWTALTYTFRGHWQCRCICGKIKIVNGRFLRNGRSKSCGCKRRIIRGDHFMSQSPEYGVWAQMKKRCYNPNAINYKDYGGRGIKVCKRWLHSFPNFFADLGKRPSPTHSLDRINNNRGYSPPNCRWTKTAQQNRNQRKTRRLVFRGKKYCAYEFARYLGVHGSTVLRYLNKSWSGNQIYQHFHKKIS